jgi:ankyrin repeat protein
MWGKCKEEGTLLHYTAKYGRAEILRLILNDRIVDLNDINLKGDTAAMLAVDQGKHEILSISQINPLLENDKDQTLLL